MCTGKTHLICSAAVVATPIVVLGGRLWPSLVNPGHMMFGAGLLAVGIFGGLFPDVDAPASELLHAPKKLARKAGWITISAIGLPKTSIPRLLVYGIFWLPGVLLSSLMAVLSLAIRSV